MKSLPPSLVLLVSLALSLPTTNARPSNPLSSLSRSWARAIRPVSASKPAVFNTGGILVGDFVCQSIGPCEPCPASASHTLPCQIYSNRRPLSCLPLHAQPGPTASDPDLARLNAMGGLARGGKTPGLSEEEDVSMGKTAGKGSFAGGEEEHEGILRGGDGVRRDGKNPRTTAGTRGETGVEKEARALSSRASTPQVSRPLIAGEILTYEACTKVVSRERADFLEFILCNSLFAIVALVVLVLRHRELAGRQYGKLAARIGVSF